MQAHHCRDHRAGKDGPLLRVRRFDGHATDVALGLLALDEANLRPQAAAWVRDLGMRSSVAYRVGRHFPIFTDSYDDLIAMRVGQAPPRGADWTLGPAADAGALARGPGHVRTLRGIS